MPSIIMDALSHEGHLWRKGHLWSLSGTPSTRSILNVGASVVYFGHGVIRHEDLMRRGPLVASMMALAAQQATQP
jgi:hypothetical protein